MAISKKDRNDYEESRKDRGKALFVPAFNDIIVNYPDTSMYYRDRSGRQLDDDKKQDKK